MEGDSSKRSPTACPLARGGWGTAVSPRAHPGTLPMGSDPLSLAIFLLHESCGPVSKGWGLTGTRDIVPSPCLLLRTFCCPVVKKKHYNPLGDRDYPDTLSKRGCRSDPIWGRSWYHQQPQHLCSHRRPLTLPWTWRSPHSVGRVTEVGASGPNGGRNSILLCLSCPDGCSVLIPAWWVKLSGSRRRGRNLSLSRKSVLGGLDFPARYLFLPVVAVCFMCCNLCLALRHQQKKNNNQVLYQQLVGNKHISNTSLFLVR